MDSNLIEIRQALPCHYPAILRLQSANYIANLGEEERQQGFLSAEFTLAQTAAIAEDLGTTIAIANHDVVGFVCAFRNEFNHGSPVVAKMIETYPVMRFEGRALSDYSSYVYGPVCIHRTYRGHGLLRGLYQAQIKELAGQFDIGVALIARNNPHSLRAHVAGLGMTEVGEFEVKGNIYATVVFRLPAKSG